MINISRILRRVRRSISKSFILSLEKIKLKRERNKKLREIAESTKKLQEEIKKQDDYNTLFVTQQKLLKFKKEIIKEQKKICKDNLKITDQKLSISNQQEQFSEQKKKLKKRENEVLKDLGRASILRKLFLSVLREEGKKLNKREKRHLRNVRAYFRQQTELTRREEFTLQIVWFFFLIVVGLLIYIKITALSTDSIIEEKITIIEEKVKESEEQTIVIKNLFKIITEQENLIGTLKAKIEIQKDALEKALERGLSFDIIELTNLLLNFIN